MILPVYVVATIVLAITSLAAPNPVNQNNQASKNSDIGILNFALTLELLESSFYKEGLSKFPEAEMRRAGVSDAGRAFRDLFHLLEHEQQHVKTLTTVIQSLGAKPVSNCEFNFNIPDVKTFLTIARSLEKVGVSAYTGALAAIQDKKLQTAGGTIATVEARHAALLNALNNIDPAPEAFDVPLSAPQVLTLASPFIRKCDVDLGLKPLTSLTILTPTARPGERIKIDTKNLGSARDECLSCNFMFSDQNLLTDLDDDVCEVPKNARGDIYVMIVRGDKPPSLDNQGAIVAGPAIFPVDTFALDSCNTIHNTENRPVNVEVDVRDYAERRQKEFELSQRVIQDNPGKVRLEKPEGDVKGNMSQGNEDVKSTYSY